MDPFDNLPFSLALDRAPILENVRYAFPGLARKARFDSVLIGSSTSRLFRPRQLNELFGARFANLAMNGSTDWEQEQLLGVFLRHHPRPKVVILGLDEQWMQPEDEYEGTRTRHEFPAWMYDDDPWNDVAHLFDAWTLEKARRQISQVLGRRRPSYERDGFWTAPPGWGHHPPEKLRALLYGPPEDGEAAQREPARPLSAAELAALRFPAHARLDRLLAAIPPDTETVLFLAPFHHHHPNRLSGGDPGPRLQIWDEAKRRIEEVVRRHPGARLLDFQIPSPLTLVDEAYMDSVHTTAEATARMAEALALSRDPDARSDLFVRRAP